MKQLLPLIVLGAVLCCGSGCSRVLRGPTLGIKIAVIDFRQPQAVSEQKRIEGWWLGARDVQESPNMGQIVAERCNRQLGRMPNVETVSRIQIKYYFADKQSYLEAATGSLTRQQALDYFYQAPAEKFGQQLGVDYIVRGEIFDSRLSRNRTIDYFWSTIDLTVDLVECGSGAVVWTGSKRMNRAFNSQVAVADKALEKLLNQMDAEYLSLR